MNDPNKPGHTSNPPHILINEWNKFFKDAGRTCSVQDILYKRDKQMVNDTAKKYGYEIYFNKAYIGFINNSNEML